MRSRFLPILVALFCVLNANASYNIGDYIYTNSGRFMITGDNLMSSDFSEFAHFSGSALNPDTIKIVTSDDGLFNYSPDGNPFLMVTGGNGWGRASNFPEFTHDNAGFYAIIPVEANKRYILTFKARAEEWRSASTQYYSQRSYNYQHIVYRADTEFSTSDLDNIASFYTYTGLDGWVLSAYSYVPTEAGYIHFWFYNLRSGDMFGDFGVYQATEVVDDRKVQNVIDEYNAYLSNVPEVEGDDTRTDITEEILPILQDFLDNPDSDVNDFNDLVDDINGSDETPIKAFLDANSVDVSSYFSNFTFDSGSTSGWSTSEGTTSFSTISKDDYFYTTHVGQHVAGSSSMTGGDFYQTLNLPKGKYLYSVKVMAHQYFINGTGNSNNKYIPDYNVKIDSLAFFLNNDTVWLDVPTKWASTFVKVFEVTEDGDITIGFHTPSNGGAGFDDIGMNTAGGSNFCFDNMELRILGENESYITDYYYKNAVTEALEELSEAISAAEADINSGDYLFGTTEFSLEIDTAKIYAQTYTSSSQESIDSINSAISALAKAVSSYYNLNLEYKTLGDDIASCNEYYADEARPNGKEDFASAISTAEDYYKAQTEDSRDSLTLVQTDSILNIALQKYLMVNASQDTPAEIYLVNNTFQMGSSYGWEQDGHTGNAVWKYGSNDDFSERYYAYYSRGSSAADLKYMWRDVTLTEPGVYIFTAELVCRNYNSGSSEDVNSQMYLFAGQDSVMTYTIINEGYTVSDSYSYTGKQKFSVTTKISDLTAINSTLRIGLSPESDSDGEFLSGLYHPNNIYFGSCHLYYYGSIDDFVDGISDVSKLDATKTGNIYSIDGKLVRSNATTLSGLQKGIYVMNGKKYVVK